MKLYSQGSTGGPCLIIVCFHSFVLHVPVSFEVRTSRMGSSAVCSSKEIIKAVQRAAEHRVTSATTRKRSMKLKKQIIRTCDHVGGGGEGRILKERQGGELRRMRHHESWRKSLPGTKSSWPFLGDVPNVFRTKTERKIALRRTKISCPNILHRNSFRFNYFVSSGHPSIRMLKN